MANRLTPADIARMIIGIQNETDPAALIAIAIDQTLASDVRRRAGERLNDVQKLATAYLRASEDQEMLRKLSRTGMVSNVIIAFAKGRLAALTNGETTKLRLIALLEQQNALLRQLPRSYRHETASPF